MTIKTIGLYINYWNEGFTIPPRRSRNPFFLIRWAQWFKSNPRSLEYMEKLFAERYPNGVFCEINKLNRFELKSYIADADEIVLVYPDAIGLGYAGIEYQVRIESSPTACIRVLNGRRRDFILSSTAQKNLRKRRLLELTMVPELLVGVLILLLTPFVIIIDLFKGKK